MGNVNTQFRIVDLTFVFRSASVVNLRWLLLFAFILFSYLVVYSVFSFTTFWGFVIAYLSTAI